ncbi:MAG TPA: MarR family EPS-associated transcriptional regulator [Marinagarivorans sp.]
MSDPVITDEVRLQLLRKLEADPNLSQRELAGELGVSLGKVNYCIKALAQVGWIKAGNFARSKNKAGYAYLLTPKGVAEKAALTTRFLEYKQKQYDSLKQEIEELKLEVKAEAGK